MKKFEENPDVGRPTEEDSPANGIDNQSGEDLNSNLKHASPCHNLESKSGLMTSEDFQRLTIRTKPGRTEVRERARVTGERVMLSVEETRDPITGEPVLRGVEYIERTVEREVETRQQHIVEIGFDDDDLGGGGHQVDHPVSPPRSIAPAPGD